MGKGFCIDRGNYSKSHTLSDKYLHFVNLLPQIQIPANDLHTKSKPFFLEISENFTEFSRVSVNGKYVETKYRSSDILYIFTDLKEGDEIVVHQVGKDNISLGETKPFIYS